MKTGRWQSVQARGLPIVNFLTGSVRMLPVIVAALVVLGAANAGVAASAKQQAVWQQVMTLAGKDQFGAAEQAALNAKEPALATLVRWMSYRSSSPDAGFVEIASFIDANPDWPLLATLQRRAEEAISPATPSAELLAWYKDREPLTAPGLHALVQALMDAGQRDKAATVARKGWQNLSFTPSQEDAFLASFSGLLREQDHWVRLDRLLWERDNAAAQRMYARVSFDHQALARARIALQDQNGKPDAAVAQVPPALRNDPGLVYERVRWRRHNELNAEAIDLLNHPARNKVYPEKWWTERNILARRALREGAISRAYQTAADHALSPDDNVREYAEAEFLAGWIALSFLKDDATALNHFQRLWQASEIPLIRSRAAYWLGRTYEARKDQKKAKEWYGKGAPYVTAFYGQLAASRLGHKHWQLPADPPVSKEDHKRFERWELAKAAQILLEIDNDLARAFLIRMIETAKTPGEKVLVGKLATRHGRDDLAVVVARRADRDGVFLIEAGWPVPKTIRSSDPEHALVLALIRQESGFMSAVRSSAGARGMMQLMPDTAKRVAKSLKVPYHPGKLDDPSYNIRLGSHYLSGIIDDFSGSYIMSLAGYNAGPGRPRRWAMEFGDPRNGEIDPVDWIEMIPFTETRGYVQRIMESLSIYRRKLGTPINTTLEADLKRSR